MLNRPWPSATAPRCHTLLWISPFSMRARPARGCPALLFTVPAIAVRPCARADPSPARTHAASTARTTNVFIPSPRRDVERPSRVPFHQIREEIRHLRSLPSPPDAPVGLEEDLDRPRSGPGESRGGDHAARQVLGRVTRPAVL